MTKLLCATAILAGRLLACGDTGSTAGSTVDADDADARDGADALVDAPDSADTADAPDGSDAVDSDSSDSTDASDEPDVIATLPIDDVLLLENSTNLLSFFAEWTTPEAASTALTVRCGDDYDEEFSSPELVTDHRVFVMGLWAAAVCQVTISSRTAGGVIGQIEREYVVGELPTTLPELEVTLSDGAQLQPGWTLVNLNNQFDDVDAQAAMIDAEGRFRWYHKRAGIGYGSDNDVRVFGDGVLFGARYRQRPAVIAWDGEVLWEADFRQHHDIRPYPDDDHFLVTQTGQEGECEGEVQTDRSVIVEWRTGVETWSYYLCQHYQPIVEVVDWLHPNSQTPFPDENAFLISSRHQHSLFKIDFETGDVVWTMGWGGRPEDGWNGDFEMAEEDRFYNQHAPEFQASGNVLLFDNGDSPNRAYSRAVEIAYDDEAMTAEVVWEYRHEPDILTEIWGDADQLDNGNRLITFGVRNRNRGSTIVEVTSDPEPEALWVLSLSGKWGVYRAERVIDPPRGDVVE